jgi:hypothetical protein
VGQRIRRDSGYADELCLPSCSSSTDTDGWSLLCIHVWHAMHTDDVSFAIAAVHVSHLGNKQIKTNKNKKKKQKKKRKNMVCVFINETV